ncbi:MAG: type II toxin-antitoxin system HicB family antitoxin [Sphaerochaetaceae bacterium]|nr:type II toxin-antitoxin system HicB family antitoxin [Sphaerochaetaceae bacterium]
MLNMMEYKGYHGTVSYSPEDNLLIGSVFGVRDSLNFHGSSVQELEDSFHDCIDTYLEVCEKNGLEPDKEYKGSFNVRIASDIHRSAAMAASSEGISLNQFIQEAISEKLQSMAV